MSAQESFAPILLPHIGKEACRMGIAGNYGIDGDDVRWAAERGANYWIYGMSYKKIKSGLKDIIKQDRERHIIAFLGMAVFGWQVRRSVEGALKQLNTDYLDVFKLGWLGVSSTDSKGVIETLVKLREEGKIRTIGASIHDRPRAGKLATDSELGALMIRYSAKHPGAETDIFPHVDKRDPAIIAYTALAWRQLIRPIKGIEMPPWPGEEPDMPPLTPEICYRFVLSNPHVHVVLTGPGNRDQLAQNLAALEAGPLTDEQMAWVREYGKKIKSKRKIDYV